MSATVTGTAFARAALAGNPSDGYGGATLALTLPAYGAEVEAFHAGAAPPVIDPPSVLVSAAVRRFARELVPGAERSASVRWRTSIPRAVGLGGSSALVIATLRALCALHAVALQPAALARLALSIEADDLGIAAGLQDRVAQSYGGLTFMDFKLPRGASSGAGRYETLDAGLLPPLFVAWRLDAGADSGFVHRELRARFEHGEPVVHTSMDELAQLARTARAALLDRDSHTFARCVDGSFDARARMMELDDRHVAMIDRARAAGASANYTGSGGAIVGVCRDPEHREAAIEAVVSIGCDAVALGAPAGAETPADSARGRAIRRYP